MNLPLYLYATNKADSLAVIICTRKPYNYGKVWFYTNKDKYAEKLAQGNLLAYAVVPGLMIIIEYAGTLEGYIEITPGVDPAKQYAGILQEMVSFYQEERKEAN